MFMYVFLLRCSKLFHSGSFVCRSVRDLSFVIIFGLPRNLNLYVIEVCNKMFPPECEVCSIYNSITGTFKLIQTHSDHYDTL